MPDKPKGLDSTTTYPEILRRYPQSIFLTDDAAARLAPWRWAIGCTAVLAFCSELCGASSEPVRK